MYYSELTGKVTEYMHICASGLANWLAQRLSDVLGNDWWHIGVLNKLSCNQQELVTNNSISSLEGLDLSALLRVADKNWYAIQSRYFMKQSERMTIQAMFGVRNTWAHASATPPTHDAIVVSLTTLADLLYFVEADRTDVLAFERLLEKIKVNGLSDAEQLRKPSVVVAAADTAIAQSEIAVHSTVHLVSDHTIKGIVIAIDLVGNTAKYKVFIRGQTKEYFEGQIEPDEAEDTNSPGSIADVRRILTAYQIRKPSSDSLYSLNSARIDFVPYQFRPALKLIKSDTPRLLIADSVGVGKTIEAGLIIKEMQARTSLDTIVIICPKPLVAERKWEIEMKRFGEEFTAVDGHTLRHIVQEAERDGEWPDKYKRLIIPYSLLTEDLLEGKIAKRGRKFPGLNALNPTPFFDMVIVDEAHHVRNSNTQAHRAVKFFCDNANAAVFLTATPLQLGNEDLFTLLNLLYPDTVIDKASFTAMVEPNSYINAAIHNLRIQGGEQDALSSLVEMLSTDWGRNVIAPNPVYKNTIETLKGTHINREQRVKLISDIESLHSFANMINRTRRQDIEDFCVRRAYTLESEFTERQRELHDELLNFISSVMGTLHPTIALKFLMCTIRRQAASCIFGLAPFIGDIVERGLNSLTDDYDIQSELEDAEIDTHGFLALAERVITLAKNLPNEDEKFDKLAEIITERQSHENNKMIIFSTFRHTQIYLYKKICAMGNIRSAAVNGIVSDDERYSLRERFVLPKNDPRALDVMLFTEVGSEGLDYQFCDSLVNYDLPWNPMRVEQRIGRIDRRGQKSDVAHIYNCITHGTIDQEIYDRCLSRIGVFERSIGDCSDILGTLAKGLNDLILDSTLTEQERNVKLEQLADNEVRKVQEMHKLEEDEKQMFGLDISTFTDDISKADNPWLSSDALKWLITGYLEKRLGSNKSYLTDGKLKLTQSEKTLLADDYRSLEKATKDAAWEQYLRSGDKVRNVTFNQDTAADPKSLFVTAVHPLVRQAAKVYSDESKVCTLTIAVNSTEISTGSYPFQFYVWEYTGNKPQTRLVPVCENTDVQSELSSIMQNATMSENTTKEYQTEWDKLAEQHLSLWRTERARHQSEVDALCRYKTESLFKSVTARKNNAIRQMSGTNNEKIIQMRTAEIERLDVEFSAKKARLEETARTADIHTTLLVNGLLTVTED